MRKIKFFLITSILCLVSVIGYGAPLTTKQLQEWRQKEKHIIAYFSDDGKHLLNNSHSVYYRQLLKVNDDGSMEVQDFYTRTNNKRTDPMILLNSENLYFGRTNSVDGKLVLWYENGQKMEERFYVKGKIEGKYLKYYESGAKAVEMNVKDSIAEGVFKRWYPNGQLMEKGYAKQDKTEGTKETWDETGRLVKQQNFRQGHIVWPRKQ